METIKPCILTVARDEEKFIFEWLNHHFSIGFKHIFIVDNNPLEKRLNLNDDRVTIIPFNDVDFCDGGWSNQYYAINYALQYIKKLDYTHLMLIDVDEFFEIRSYPNVCDFISNEMVNKGDSIVEVVWETYDDNDIIYERDTRPNVVDTYTRKQEKLEPYKFNQNEASWTKSIVKIVDGLSYDSAHWPSQVLFDNGTYKTNHLNPDVAVLKHYRTKCLETFVKHKMLQCMLERSDYGKNVVDAYFEINSETNEKLKSFKEILNRYGVHKYDEQLDNMLT